MTLNLSEIVRQLKPVRGQRLAAWLTRFLVAHPDQLSRWSGTWTEVNTAKVVEIFRRRGVVDEHEANTARFGVIVNASYRCQPYAPPVAAARQSPETLGEKILAARVARDRPTAPTSEFDVEAD